MFAENYYMYPYNFMFAENYYMYPYNFCKTVICNEAAT